MGTFDNGFIKIYRTMLDWEWYRDANTMRVFLHCLIRANWKEGKFCGETIKRGSFVTSYQNLATELCLSVQAVRTALKHLNSTGEITHRSTNKYTVISVNNYDEYQDDNKQLNKRITNKQQTNNKRVTTNEESKKVRKKEKDKNKPPHPGWIPADSHDGIYVFSHPSSEGWRIEVVDGKEWGYQVEQ